MYRPSLATICAIARLIDIANAATTRKTTLYICTHQSPVRDSLLSNVVEKEEGRPKSSEEANGAKARDPRAI